MIDHFRMPVVYDDAVDMHVREGTYDPQSAREVRSIIKKMEIGHEDVLLDVGGHIGEFARPCLKLGARVVTVEPEPENIQLLQLNVQEWSPPQIQVWFCAVTDDPVRLQAETTTLYRPKPASKNRPHTGIDSLHPAKGREPVEVAVRSFRALLNHIQPTALKVDIEGGEWLLDWKLPLPGCVRKLHVEMHMRTSDVNALGICGRDLAPILHELLCAQGFEVVVEPNFTRMWGTHPVYRR